MNFQFPISNFRFFSQSLLTSAAGRIEMLPASAYFDSRRADGKQRASCAGKVINQCSNARQVFGEKRVEQNHVRFSARILLNAARNSFRQRDHKISNSAIFFFVCFARCNRKSASVIGVTGCRLMADAGRAGEFRRRCQCRSAQNDFRKRETSERGRGDQQRHERRAENVRRDVNHTANAADCRRGIKCASRLCNEHAARRGPSIFSKRGPQFAFPSPPAVIERVMPATPTACKFGNRRNCARVGGSINNSVRIPGKRELFQRIGRAGEIIAVKCEQEFAHPPFFPNFSTRFCSSGYFAAASSIVEPFDRGFPPFVQRAHARSRAVGMGHDAAAGHVKHIDRLGAAKRFRRLAAPLAGRNHGQHGYPPSNGLRHASMELTTESSDSQNLFAMPLT